jgi:hypothetical protein
VDLTSLWKTLAVGKWQFASIFRRALSVRKGLPSHSTVEYVLCASRSEDERDDVIHPLRSIRDGLDALTFPSYPAMISMNWVLLLITALVSAGRDLYLHNKPSALIACACFPIAVATRGCILPASPVRKKHIISTEAILRRQCYQARHIDPRKYGGAKTRRTATSLSSQTQESSVVSLRRQRPQCIGWQSRSRFWV